MRGYSYMLLFAALLYARINLLIAQDNSLTFSPSTPLCIGETVQMTCYVVPPTTQPFDSSAALISFNDSLAANISTINTSTLAGIDTSRYTADTSGLDNNASRPGIRLTITDYQASDGATNFSCHGLYSGGVPSPAIISGYPQRLADPPSSFTLDLSQKENSCFTDLIWSPHITDRSITSYSVYRDGLLIATVPSNTTRYTDDQINVTMYSVVATSCAGSVAVEIMSAKLEYYVTSLIVSYDERNGEILLNWVISRESILASATIPNSSDLLSATFSLPATKTSYNITKVIQPPSFAREGDGDIDREIRVCIHITEQCGQVVTEMMICNYSYSVIHRPVTAASSVSIVLGVLICICFCCCCFCCCCCCCCCCCPLILNELINVRVSKKKRKAYSLSYTKMQLKTREPQEPTNNVNIGNKKSKQQLVEEEKIEGTCEHRPHDTQVRKPQET